MNGRFFEINPLLVLALIALCITVYHLFASW